MKLLPVLPLLALLLLPACDSALTYVEPSPETIEGRWIEAWQEINSHTIAVCETGPHASPCPPSTEYFLKHTTKLKLFDGRFAAFTQTLVFSDSVDHADTLRVRSSVEAGFYELRGDTLLLRREKPEVSERYVVRLHVDSLRLEAPLACGPPESVCAYEVPSARLPWAGVGFLKLGGRFVQGGRW